MNSDVRSPAIYIRIPKKFIDFTRSGKGADEGAEDAAEGDEASEKKKKKASRLAKKKENATSYELNDPLVWKLKIENAESDDPARQPSVILDVPEAMENMCVEFAWVCVPLLTLPLQRVPAHDIAAWYGTTPRLAQQCRAARNKAVRCA